MAYATDDNAIIWKLEKQSFSLQFLETMQHWSDREKAIVAYLKSVAHSEQYRPFTHLQLFFRLVAKSLVRIQDRARVCYLQEQKLIAIQQTMAALGGVATVTPSISIVSKELIESFSRAGNP